MSLRRLTLLALFHNALGWRAMPPSSLWPSRQSTKTRLAMGLMDSLSNFLSNRQGDFVKLDVSSDVAFGPGPLLIAYNIPAGIANDEIHDMIADGAPQAFNQKCQIRRVSNQDATILDLSLEQALQGLATGTLSSSSLVGVEASTGSTPGVSHVPVLFFSGFQNDEMLAVYNILASEIYQEMGGQQSAACAKAVPNAMGKPLRQVLEEISSDHKDALAMDDNKL